MKHDQRLNGAVQMNMSLENAGKKLRGPDLAPRLRLKEVPDLHAIIDPVVRKVGEYAVYTSGWSDERVWSELVAKLGHPVAEESVAAYRRARYGNFPPRVPAPKEQKPAVEIAALRDRVALLEAQVAALCASLGVHTGDLGQ
jgi:hypothetical protein